MLGVGVVTGQCPGTLELTPTKWQWFSWIWQIQGISLERHLHLPCLPLWKTSPPKGVVQAGLGHLEKGLDKCLGDEPLTRKSWAADPQKPVRESPAPEST